MQVIRIVILNNCNNSSKVENMRIIITALFIYNTLDKSRNYYGCS